MGALLTTAHAPARFLKLVGHFHRSRAVFNLKSDFGLGLVSLDAHFPNLGVESLEIQGAVMGQVFLNRRSDVGFRALGLAGNLAWGGVGNRCSFPQPAICMKNKKIIAREVSSFILDSQWRGPAAVSGNYLPQCSTILFSG